MINYDKHLAPSIIKEYEDNRINNPKFFGKWFITCKKDFTSYLSSSADFLAGETYRIHDKAFDLWGPVTYQVSGGMLSWIKWEDLLEYFELNEEMKELLSKK